MAMPAGLWVRYRHIAVLDIEEIRGVGTVRPMLGKGRLALVALKDPGWRELDLQFHLLHRHMHMLQFSLQALLHPVSLSLAVSLRPWPVLLLFGAHRISGKIWFASLLVCRLLSGCQEPEMRAPLILLQVNQNKKRL